MSPRLRGNLFLALAALIWGLSFVVHKSIAGKMNPIAFSGLRYLCGSFFLVPLALFFNRRRKPPKGDLWLLGGILGGLAITVAGALQQYGLIYATAGQTGFITGLYVIMVSVFGIFLGFIPRIWLWPGLILALFGLYFLSIPLGSFSLGKGEKILLIADIFWATHILLVAYFAPRSEIWLLTALQAVIAAFLSLSLAFILGKFITFEQLKIIWPAAIWGVFSVGVAYFCQSFGQRYSAPAPAALIMQCQSLIGATAGVLILKEVMTGRMIFGAFLIVCGVLIAQLFGQQKKKY